MSIALHYVTLNVEARTLEFTKNKPTLSATGSMLALRRFSKMQRHNQKVTEEIRKAALLIRDNFELKCAFERRKQSFVKRMIVFIKKTYLKLILRDFIAISSDSELEFNEKTSLLPHSSAR